MLQKDSAEWLATQTENFTLRGAQPQACDIVNEQIVIGCNETWQP
jgi:hypothetical protein